MPAAAWVTVVIVTALIIAAAALGPAAGHLPPPGRDRDARRGDRRGRA